MPAVNPPARLHSCRHRGMITYDHKRLHMPQPTEPITVRAATDMLREIDALAVTLARSRNYVVFQASREFGGHHTHFPKRTA